MIDIVMSMVKAITGIQKIFKTYGIIFAYNLDESAHLAFP